MKRLFGILSACLLMAALHSCTSDNNAPTITEQTFDKCFAYVKDLTTGADAYYENLGYQVLINVSDRTADLYISGLKTTDGTSYPTIALKNLSWTTEDNLWVVITGKDVVPEIPGFANIPLFSNIDFRICARIVNNESYIPGVCARFTIDMKYAITSSYADQIMFGTTKSTAASTGSQFETTETNYVVNFNVQTRRVDISMIGAQFSAAMSQPMNIDLKNIPFTISGSKAIWDVASITPEIAGVPYPTFPITNLKGEFDFGGEFEMDFDCDPAPVADSYKVEIDCDYKYTK